MGTLREPTPNQHGEIDIILRATNPHEAQLAQPEQLDEFLTLLTKPPDIPRDQLWFTSETLILCILWGLLVGYTVGFIKGFSEVVDYIQSNLFPYVDQEFFQQQLHTVCWELWVEGYINYNDDGEIIPTAM
ncbi:MAG: hypothetical protein JSW11_01270 [Candidatus Heimdallarchaeota archaeon]|nr:MAG: hypothetical protein JSW11_01270 [Candidatus Heimdallarchaeota archaeon]